MDDIKIEPDIDAIVAEIASSQDHLLSSEGPELNDFASTNTGGVMEMDLLVNQKKKLDTVDNEVFMDEKETAPQFEVEDVPISFRETEYKIPKPTIHSTGDLKFSIITPCYNVEKYLDETAESVLSQTYENTRCCGIIAIPSSP